MPHTYWSPLLHFDKVRPTLVVEFSCASVVEQRYVQFFLQVALHLVQLQSTDTIRTVHGELLLVIRAIGLPGSQRFTNWFIMPHARTHTHAW